MTAKPAIGRNNYRQAVSRGQFATEEARRALRRIVDETPGPQTLFMLVAKAALALNEINTVLTELDEIGRNARTTGQLELGE